MSKKSINPEEELARQEAYPEPLNFEGLERRVNYRIIAYREDILHILEKKDAAAIIYHIVYRWLEHKRDEILKEMEHHKKIGQTPLTNEEIEQRMWIYMSYTDFARETGGGISYNTVIATLNYLINTKKVLERRENHDPRFSDYEYRINKREVAKLLAALPTSPPTYTKVGTGKRGNTSTNIGTASTNVGTPTLKSGTASTKSGTPTIPDLGDITEAAQNPPQDLSQITTQQQSSNNPQSEQASTAVMNLSLETLTEEEIILIQAYRQGILKVDLELSENLGGQASSSEESKQVEIVTQKIATEAVEQPPVSGEEQILLARPAKVTTAEEVVQMWEYVRQARYGTSERVVQLRAATTLLGMQLPLPLTSELLETLYAAGFDSYWKKEFGELHVTHLVGVEKSSGQVRVVRWINRLQTPGPEKGGALLTQPGQHILELYQQFRGRKIIPTEETVLAANTLAEFVVDEQDFLRVLKAIAADDFLKQKKVRWDLAYVYHHYDAFFDVVKRTLGKPASEGNEKVDYTEVMGLTDEQRADYKRQQQEKYAPPGVDREALMKLSIDERLAYIRKMREEASTNVG